MLTITSTIVDDALALNLSGKKKERFIKNYLPGYATIKDDPLIKLRDDFTAYREAFYKVREHIDKGEQIPEELRLTLQKAQGYISGAMIQSDVLTENNEHGKYIALCTDAFSDHEHYDVEAFKKIEFLITKDVPAILNTSQKMDEYLETLKDQSKTKEREQAKQAFVESAKRMEAARTTRKAPLIKLKEMLLGMDTKEKMVEVNADLTHMLSVSSGQLSNKFESLKGMRQAYEQLKTKLPPEEVQKTWNNYEVHVDEFLVQYGMVAHELLNTHHDKYQMLESISDLQSNDRMPDFVTQMGDCMETHYVRSGGKLGTKYEPEIERLKRMAAEANRKANNIQMTPEQKEAYDKAEQKYQEQKKKYLEDRELKLLELEDARVQSEIARKQRKRDREKAAEEKRQAAIKAEQERQRKLMEKQKKEYEKQQKELENQRLKREKEKQKKKK